MENLSEAARAVITSLQALPEAPELQRANIDVDILIFDRDRAICTLDLRAKLASRFPDEFEDVPEPVSSCLNIPDRVKADFIPQELVPYLPANAVTLEKVDPNHLPFLSLQDLLVYKINSCSMRPTADKRYQDARDAQVLANIQSWQGTITLDDSQKQAVLSGLDEMSEYSRESRQWWESALGLSGSMTERFS
ncbi:hypothetical protein IFM61606_06084 [Aspergillus udagawae]|uniref:Uncharacterized protein n=1 Tax=Aspergillus udagawae TaxID=91492 RepID=A0ABQ1ACS1_9EURO|nr:hypothetical protein IFM53868_02495 [Aspergillus udagawae]GFG18151.1 hypothetical protein IFM5058_08860 [Aspergillus udagawae]GFG26116.1 hypothetical protein IFM61606_06084 [Aspergillus udagawae]